ncbi:MAG TPA: Lrp/AsnC family transcriptional regulator [Anaerolineae bacterium]|nr:Lrp/AsnC family transcriptional regulator [Anaerolineae bacterium]
MALDNAKLLDEVGWRILGALQEDGRLSFAELGRRVGLSLPAVAERVRRLEEAGIITGYRAEVNLAKIGLTIMAFIRMYTPRDQYPGLIALLNRLPQALECHHLTGSESFIIKIAVTSMADLETLIGQLSAYGQTTTSIVLSSSLSKKVITREAAEAKGTDAP